MDDIRLVIPNVVPGALPEEIYPIVNELYLQLANLVKEFNRRQGILKSANGHYWRVNVSNTGVLSTTDLGTVLP